MRIILASIFSLTALSITASASAASIHSILPYYLQDSKGLSLSIKKVKTGVSNIKLKFREGTVGDFKYSDYGLDVKNLDIYAKNFSYAKGKSGSGPRTKGLIEIRSLEIEEHAVEQFMLSYFPKLRTLSMDFDGGYIIARGKYGKTKFKAVFIIYNPYPGTTSSDICFKLKKISALNIRLPAWPVNAAIKKYNFFLSRANTGLKFKFGEIILKGGKITIL